MQSALGVLISAEITATNQIGQQRILSVWCFPFWLVLFRLCTHAVTSNHTQYRHSFSRFSKIVCVCSFETFVAPILIRFYDGFSDLLFFLILFRFTLPDEWVMIQFFSLCRCFPNVVGLVVAGIIPMYVKVFVCFGIWWIHRNFHAHFQCLCFLFVFIFRFGAFFTTCTNRENTRYFRCIFVYLFAL